ncbi:uncharacterized protein LOC143554225 [Bidens hawaiensis]|uniref:uncharacterized protein LOC143554225 n=1 Tax=Bidens hawaiensis TaxID=980011 RepID=UPI0040494E2D
MAAKYLYSLADDNPDLHKQIGCMTGVFQIFNRHHNIVSRRRISGHTPNRGDHGGSLYNNGTPQMESRVSTESSKESSASRPINRQNLDLRDVVKDSMHREARGLSHNIAMVKESNSWYHDEPRELSRSKSCRFTDRIPRFSYDGLETDSKTTNPKQLKELPRLSIDSHSRNMKINGGVNANEDLSQTRLPGVVAKLMGLETFPLLKKSPVSPCLKNPDMKPISRVPIEPAPWKRESNIVIMKPKKLIKNGFTNNKATGQDRISESTREKRRSRPSVPLKDSSKPRKDSNKQQLESQSLNGRKKPSNFKKIEDKNKETKMLSSSTPEKTTLLVKTSEPLTPEHLSPVSVLDDSVYVDNSPSPVKRTPITKKDSAAKKTVKDRHEPTNVDQTRTTTPSIKFQTNREKLKKVSDLVQRLKNLEPNEPHTDYIASLCETTTPDNKYISEILLSSGLLLRDLQSFTLHPSGHPINPELFFVLEHTKYSNLQKDRFHRKLIFDAVNDILVEKLGLVSGMMMQDSRKLLRELCLEVEQVQMCKKIDGCGLGDDDVLKKSETWTGFYGESCDIAMEVERLILLDLVDEVVDETIDAAGFFVLKNIT